METGPGTSCKTMNDESQEEVGMQQESSGEASSTDELAPLTDNTSRYYEVMTELLSENMYNLSVESDLEDDDWDLNPYASSRGPPIPFVINDYLGDDVEEIDIDYKISKIEDLEQMTVNSPRWYALVRSHLTEEEREELWKRTPWAIKFYWDDSDDADDADVDDIGPAARPLFKDPSYIEL
ncbi:uncharacterized protein LOC126780418 isoform X2 [Nymphalis io]|uniref:uncharacterized protein LOC126780418 isoform X2 n=1 Tax=Inachis io TaxID=171585 RepID=UPI00216A76C4|nr:uncharacterized protein LOC126780418 isoform X2 [Nymphalis io]